MALTPRAIALVALLASTRVSAQAFPDSSRVAVSLNYGDFEFDLSGTGKSRMVAARVERPFTRFVLGEGGVLLARPKQQFSSDPTTFVVAEVQVQAQLPIGRAAPYLGFGGGVALDFREGNAGAPPGIEDERDPTVSAAAGLRFWFTQVFGGRAELRVRGIGGGFQGASAEWTIGALLRL